MYQSVSGVVAFIANNPVRPIHSPDNPFLSKWYINNSMVFVSHTHSLWESDRKTSKRYGRLFKSPASQLHEIMLQHRSEVFVFIRERTKAEEMKSGNSGDEFVSREDIVMSLEK